MSKPLWLTRMSYAARARLLGKAFAILKDFESTKPKGGWNLQPAMDTIWLLKSWYEQESKKD